MGKFPLTLIRGIRNVQGTDNNAGYSTIRVLSLAHVELYFVQTGCGKGTLICHSELWNSVSSPHESLPSLSASLLLTRLGYK